MVLAVWACAFACGIAVAILGQAQVVAASRWLRWGWQPGACVAARGSARLRQPRWQRASGWASVRLGSAKLRGRARGHAGSRIGQVVTGPEAGAGEGDSKKMRFLLAFHSVEASLWKPEPS